MKNFLLAIGTSVVIAISGCGGSNAATAESVEEVSARNEAIRRDVLALGLAHLTEWNRYECSMRDKSILDWVNQMGATEVENGYFASILSQEVSGWFATDARHFGWRLYEGAFMDIGLVTSGGRTVDAYIVKQAVKVHIVERAIQHREITFFHHLERMWGEDTADEHRNIWREYQEEVVEAFNDRLSALLDS